MHHRKKRGAALVELACLAELFICLVSSGRLFARANSPLFASYNPTFTAPACLELGSSCQTDDYMIAGVGSFETNYPNTVDNCTDDSVAVYQQDEYINRIIVRAKDGGTMQAGDGNTLQIHVTVRIADDASGRHHTAATDPKEVVHIFYASDVLETNMPIGVNSTNYFANAHWKYICTRMSDIGRGFMAVFSCDFELPEGNFADSGIQAVRVNYGFAEYAIEACTKTPLWGTPYTDVDDLVFRVAPAPGSPSAMPSQSPSTETSAPTPRPTSTSPVASDYHYFCAETPKEARDQCSDNRPCPIGNECEIGSSCWPVHCTDCPDIPCSTENATLAPTPSGSPSTDAPTSILTFELPSNGNSAPGMKNFEWVFGVMLAVIDVLLMT